MKTSARQPFTIAIALTVAVLATSACKGGGADGGGFVHENTPANLEQLWSSIVGAVKAGDNDKALAIAKSMLMTDASYKVALRDGVDPAVIASAKKQQEQLANAKPEDMAKGFKAERSEVKSHGATAKEIAAQETPASQEFPGGAKRAAETILNEGVTFYEVELLEPGQDLGTKMHLMFWDGSQWRMLGAVWRGLPN